MVMKSVLCLNALVAIKNLQTKQNLIFLCLHTKFAYVGLFVNICVCVLVQNTVLSVQSSSCLSPPVISCLLLHPEDGKDHRKH